MEFFKNSLKRGEKNGIRKILTLINFLLDYNRNLRDDYIKRMKWGFGKKEMKLAIYIRDGLMTRDEALEQLKDANKEPKEMDFWLESLNLTRDDLRGVKDLSYDGYKSYNFRLLKFLRKYTKLVSFPYDEELE